MKNDNTESNEIVSRDDVKNTIIELAKEEFVLDEDEIENFEELNFETDLNCESLDIVEFIMGIEDEFGIVISEDESDSMQTTGDCVELVWQKVSSENFD